MYLPDNSLLATLDKTNNLLYLTRNVPVTVSATPPSTSTLALVVLAALVALFQCSR